MSLGVRKSQADNTRTNRRNVADARCKAIQETEALMFAKATLCIVRDTQLSRSQTFFIISVYKQSVSECLKIKIVTFSPAFYVAKQLSPTNSNFGFFL